LKIQKNVWGGEQPPRQTYPLQIGDNPPLMPQPSLPPVFDPTLLFSVTSPSAGSPFQCSTVVLCDYVSYNVMYC